MLAVLSVYLYSKETGIMSMPCLIITIGTCLGLSASVALLVLMFRLLIKVEIRDKKDKRDIDVEDEDWAAAEEEHRESAVIGMTALSIGKITVVIR
jgi:hypothetical protein